MSDVLGANVRRLREERNWTQGDLAERVGIHRSTLVDIEKGRASNLGLGTIERLADVLGVVPSILLVAPAPPRRKRSA